MLREQWHSANPVQRQQMIEHARERHEKARCRGRRPRRRGRSAAEPAPGGYFAAPPLLRGRTGIRYVAHVQACGRHLEPFFVPAAPRLA